MEIVPDKKYHHFSDNIFDAEMDSDEPDKENHDKEDTENVRMHLVEIFLSKRLFTFCLYQFIAKYDIFYSMITTLHVKCYSSSIYFKIHTR